MPDWLPTALGIVAGILSTTSFVPQVKKAWQEGTESVSKRMYVVTVAAFVLWTTYGFLLGSLPLILFNVLSLCLSGAILFLKIRNERRGEGGSARDGEGRGKVAATGAR
jgi:MtN3 and saliva related transmembrane protein